MYYNGVYRPIHEYTEKVRQTKAMAAWGLPYTEYAFSAGDKFGIIDPTVLVGDTVKVVPSADNMASYINEPPKGTSANCKFEIMVNIEDSVQTHHIVVVTCRNIKQGGQLFALYGSQYPRDYEASKKGCP